MTSALLKSPAACHASRMASPLPTWPAANYASSSYRARPAAVSCFLPRRVCRGASIRRQRKHVTVPGKPLPLRCALVEPPSKEESKTHPLPSPPAASDSTGTWLDRASNWLTELLGSGSSSGMPIAKGNVSDLVGKPLFYFLYDSFLKYGSVYKLEFGPKAFVVVSDPAVARHILKDNAMAYDKGMLAEILEPIMGKGLIPADLETWKERRRAVVPAFHSAFLDAMVGTFGRCAQQTVSKLDSLLTAAQREEGHTTGAPGPAAAVRVEMEAEFSSLALDIIGLAVFNFDFGSVTKESPIIQAVYTVLYEAEHRSTFYLPYWKIPGASLVVPRQRKFQLELKAINDCLDDLINRALASRQEDDLEALLQRDYSKVKDASVLRFLVDMRGEDCSSRQLRDDLMTMLIAGHETTAAVLTWATYKLAQDPQLQQRMQREIDSVLGPRTSLTLEDLKKLKLVRLVVAESLRLYPQPPLLIRRSLQSDTWPVGMSGNSSAFQIGKGTDVFIAVYNLHRSPALWDAPEEFNPDRFEEAHPGAPQGGWEGYDPVKAQNSLYPNEVASDFAFLPFGGGARKCVGDQFALLESTAALALLLQKFNISLAGAPEDVQLVTGATIHTKDGLWCLVSRRQTLAQAEVDLSAAVSSA